MPCHWRRHRVIILNEETKQEEAVMLQVILANWGKVILSYSSIAAR
jgi:hypothetical protein